jgi:hypothetical protein
MHGAGAKQQRLDERCLACIHMGEYANNSSLDGFLLFAVLLDSIINQHQLQPGWDGAFAWLRLI